MTGGADCSRAIDDAAAASARFAALPPTQVFGNVKIGIGQRVDIDATGGAVISIASLSMAGGKTLYFDDEDGRFPSCSLSDDKKSTFRITAGANDQVVVNIGSLKLGNCAGFFMTENTVVNVPPARR